MAASGVVMAARAEERGRSGLKADRVVVRLPQPMDVSFHPRSGPRCG